MHKYKYKIVNNVRYLLTLRKKAHEIEELKIKISPP